jgi:hypothetical protein
MKNRKLIVLSLVTLAVILAAGITARLRAPQSTFNRQVLFPDLAGRINDIAGITIKGNKQTIVLQQQGERWVLASTDNYPALFNRIKQNVVGMSELRIVDEKTDKPEFYGRLGVEGPDVEGTKSMLITLKDKSGQTIAELIVGNKRQSSSNKPGLYVRKPDSARALLVEGALDIPDDPSRWFETHLFDISSTHVQEVRIRYPRTGEQPLDDLVIRKDTMEQPDFDVNIPALGREPSIAIIANRISRGLEEMRADNAHSLQNFNFPDNDTITTTISTFDGLVVTARLVKKDKAHYANFTFTANPSATAAKPENADKTSPGTNASKEEQPSPAAEVEALNKNLSPWVYEIPDFLYEALTTRPDQFRKLNLLPNEE